VGSNKGGVKAAMHGVVAGTACTIVHRLLAASYCRGRGLCVLCARVTEISCILVVLHHMCSVVVELLIIVQRAAIGTRLGFQPLRSTCILGHTNFISHLTHCPCHGALQAS
jgi:hypothetical protein